MVLSGSGKLLSIGMVAPQPQDHTLRVDRCSVLSELAQALLCAGQVMFKPVAISRD